MTGPILLRYTKDQFLVPAASIRVLRQRFTRADVHWHDFYELVYLLEGTARHVVNGREFRLVPGSAFIMTPADFHEIVVDGGDPLTCYNVIIDPAALDHGIDELVPSTTDEATWHVEDFTEAAPDFARLWEESRRERRGTSVAISALVHCILVALARRCAGTDAGRAFGRVTPEASIRHATLYIDHHFREPITLAGVAAQAHLSPNYFSERFHELTGVSFQTYLQRRRLRFARALLCATNLGITEICHAAGFNNPSHFGRAYRRQYGHSPSVDRGDGTERADNADSADVIDLTGANHRAGVAALGRWGAERATARR